MHTHTHSARLWPVLGAQDKEGGDVGMDKDTIQPVLRSSGINSGGESRCRCLCWAACGSDGCMDRQMDEGV